MHQVQEGRLGGFLVVKVSTSATKRNNKSNLKPKLTSKKEEKVQFDIIHKAKLFNRKRWWRCGEVVAL